MSCEEGRKKGKHGEGRKVGRKEERKDGRIERRNEGLKREYRDEGEGSEERNFIQRFIVLGIKTIHNCNLYVDFLPHQSIYNNS